MIALWGHPTDYPMIAVRQALATMGAAVLFIDQEQILETHLDLDVEQHATGTLRVGRERVALANIGAVYLRPHDTLSLGAMSTASTDVQSAAIEFERDLAAWANVTEAGVVNRPSAMASNASKPHQTALIQEHGFHVPKTLLTTDMSAVKRFWATHERVIFKSMSSVRSVVVELSTAHLARLSDLTTCPVQFQQLIVGTDVRVHVVGDDVFACTIEADDTDYRYATKCVIMRTCELAAQVANMCRQLSVSLGLRVAGIDLRRTPDGRWYCFEANPSPGFTFYAAQTMQPIGAAIASLLVRLDGAH